MEKVGHESHEAVHPLLEDLRKRTTLLPLPPDGFDPLKAPVAKLREFGLPVPNDAPEGSPGRLARLRFLTGPPSGALLKYTLALIDGGVPGWAPQPSAVWPGQKSSNWSGGYVAPRDGHSIVWMTGRWTVPAVAKPGGGTEPEYHSSTWIGVDGQHAYRDSTLPQIGTKQVFSPATATATATATYTTWYQWWARGRHAPPQPLGLAVNAGDVVHAILDVLDETTVRLNLKNETLGNIQQTVLVSAPAQCRVSGASAEWIMERPSPLGNDGWYPYHLPAYQPFSFIDCIAESEVGGGTAKRTIDLELAPLIRMYQINPTPPALRTISVAHKTDQSLQRLDLNYVGP